MSDDVVPISQTTLNERCPSCNNPNLTRFGQPQLHTRSMNGATLYTLIEQCNICSWQVVTENVKMSA